MTLRVRISIVPFGDETKERELYQINISNLGKHIGDDYNYGIEMNKYEGNNYLARVTHSRSEGPIKLVFKALKRVLELES
jgi:hypothetical protein